MDTNLREASFTEESPEKYLVTSSIAIWVPRHAGKGIVSEKPPITSNECPQVIVTPLWK